MVALWGYEDALAWRVVAGAAEAIQRDDADFLVMDQPALLVRKADGVLDRLVVIEHLERLAAMTPYGPGTRGRPVRLNAPLRSRPRTPRR